VVERVYGGVFVVEPQNTPISSPNSGNSQRAYQNARRTKKLCFHQILVTQELEALRDAIGNASKISQYAKFDTIIQEQDLLRQLASASAINRVILPSVC
jgi:hypothetical protein